MPRTSLVQTVASSGLRAVLIAFATVLVVATIWICLIAGLVVILSPPLGLGGALLAVAGGLIAICGISLAVLVLARPEPPPAPGAGLKEEAATMALRVLQAPGGRRLALGAAGALMVAFAIFAGGPNKDPRE